VDIGSGKGRFLLGRSGRFPQHNFLGIERLLGRVNQSGRRCERAGRENVHIFRMEGFYTINSLMPSEYVHAYFFLFPDPWPKARHHAHRLFDPSFMNAIHRTLNTQGSLHIATDHLPYFEEIDALLNADSRFKRITPFQPTEEEQTDFELLFKEKPIGRCSFQKCT